MLDHVDCIVIGAGVIGLACARALAASGRETLILEANGRFGEESSARSNEVIHAGFLYPPGSLKERLCAPGARALYAYCAERGIPHRRIGKLMPAVTEAHVRILEGLRAQGVANGIDVSLLDSEAARALEPSLVCRAALHSPGTGIVDSHALMLALLADAEAAGTTLALRTQVRALALGDDGRFIVEAVSPGAQTAISAGCLVNCAGLDAERLARQIEPDGGRGVPRVHFAKGTFYRYRGAAPFRHLIVPLAETLAGGGAFTLDLAGQGRFGADLEWVPARDYGVAATLAPGFARHIAGYWPAVEVDRLEPGYAGIRPRTTGPGEPLADWCVRGPREHGVPGLVNLLAMESPGLTSSLVLGAHVASLV